VKQCILTVTLPSGQKFGYTTPKTYRKAQEAKAAAAVLACEDDIVRRMGQEQSASKFAVLWDWDDPAATWFAKNTQKTKRPWDTSGEQEKGVEVGGTADVGEAETAPVYVEEDGEDIGMKRIDATLAAHPPCTGSWHWMKEVRAGEAPGTSHYSSLFLLSS
jgi:hypothetical protein